MCILEGGKRWISWILREIRCYQGWTTLVRYGDGEDGGGKLLTALSWLRVIWFLWSRCRGLSRKQRFIQGNLLVFMDNNLLPVKEQRHMLGFLWRKYNSTPTPISFLQMVSDLVLEICAGVECDLSEKPALTKRRTKLQFSRNGSE